MQQQLKDADLIQLYKESFPDAARIIKGLGGGLEDAKDVFHDALLAYLEKERKAMLNISVSPKAYLLGITRILWLQKQRKATKAPVIDERDWVMSDENHPDERERTALEWLQVAGQRCLRLLKAFYYDGASMTEVAERVGLKSSRSATVQKYKCLEKIRKAIKKEVAYEV